MKICIVAHNAYGALTGENSGHIGGVERQTELMSRWLASRGHEVSVITWHEGGDDIEQLGDIRVIKLCRPKQGIPVLRFFIPRWSSLIRALRVADADLYYHNCFEAVTGQVALWCRLHNKPFVYSVANESDCDNRFRGKHPWYEIRFFRYGLLHADLLIAQTKRQQQKLMSNYRLKSTVINMPGTPPTFRPGYQREKLYDNRNILWVGRLRSVKRIDWLLDVAKRLPELQFTVAGPKDDSPQYIQRILSRIDETPNVTYLGKVSRSDMIDVYQNASLLCCTSVFEGFPNIFLEAWSYGLPLVTTFDPDDIVQSHNLGAFVTTQDELAEALGRFIDDKESWLESSQNCFDYYREHHAPEQVMSQFEQAFIALLENDVGHHFDQQSDEWHDYYTRRSASISHLDLQQRLAHTQALLQNLEPECDNKRLLDLGCGTGSSFEAISQTGDWDIYAIDISPKMVKTALARGPHIHVSQGNATQMSFADKRFSVVVALGVLEYIEDYPRALDEIHRVLTENGRFIVSVPNQSSLFRRLRKLEKVITRPLKKLLGHSARKDEIFHRQWSLAEFSDTLQAHHFALEQVRFSSYGLLSPKFEDSAFNIRLSHWLTKKLTDHPRLNLLLANTVTLQAKAIGDEQ